MIRKSLLNIVRTHRVWLLPVMAFTALAIGMTIAGPLSAAPPSEPAVPLWKEIPPGFEVLTIEDGSGLFSSSLQALRLSLEQFRIEVVRASNFGASRSTVRNLCESSNAFACINANFFDEAGRALGLVVSHGITSQHTHRGGTTLTGIFQLTRTHASIVNRQDFEPSNVLEAVQAGPRLIIQGQQVAGLRESSTRSNRSGVCIDRKQRVVFYALESGFFGWSLDNLRERLMAPPFECVDALNLDGGGSTQFFVRGTDHHAEPLISIEGSDQVPVALAIFPRGSF